MNHPKNILPFEFVFAIEYEIHLSQTGLVPNASVTIPMCAKNLLGLFLQSTLVISSLFSIVSS